MKPTTKTTILILSLFFAFYFSVSSCKKVEDPRVIIDGKDTIYYDLLKTSIYLQFIDVNTNELIIAEDGNSLKVKIIGKSKAAVVDITGLYKEEYVAKNGFLTFGLNPNSEYIPSIQSPTNFTIIANVDNYLTAEKEVNLTTEGDYIIKVYMVNATNPPPGVIYTHKYELGSVIDGVVQEDIVISTPSNEAILTIKQGAKLLTIDSVPLNNTLNVKLTYYNGLDDKALLSIPGGVTGNVLQNNNTSRGMFFSTGVLKYTIYDAQWRRASIITDDSLKISLKIPNTTYNPISGTSVVIGDSVPTYSYVADTGFWAFNQWTHITDTINNSYYLTIKTQENNYLNFGWFEEINCNQNTEIQLSSNSSQCTSAMIEGVIRKQADNKLVSNITIAGVFNNNSVLPIMLGNIPVYFEWEQPNDSNNCFVDPSLNPLLVDDMCSQQIIELPVSFNNPTAKSITAYFEQIYNSDTNTILMPSYGLWIKKQEATCWRWVMMKDGVANICNVTLDENYTLGSYYNGNWKEWQLLVTDENLYHFEL